MPEATFTVSELNEFLKISFDNSEILKDIYIKGEISNFTNHFKTGHFYFTLKDSESSLKAVMFRMFARNINFIPENGMKVIAHGKIDVFVRDGTYSLKVDELVPEGIGNAYLAFEQLKLKLEKEGLFSTEHKKELPAYPEKIGVLTSLTGAVIRDIQNVASRRYPLCDIILYPCAVQGTDASRQIIEGLRHFEQSDVDIVIIARGGGSLEDLMPFNDEKLARAVFSCEKPVISAVGHETDFTICDFVSDLRAPTPSAAAELALPSVSEIQTELEHFKKRLDFLIDGVLNSKSETLKSLSEKSILSKPFAVLDVIEQNISDLNEKLNKAANGVIEYKKGVLDNIELRNKVFKILEIKSYELSALVAKTEALSPLAVIARGYSVVYKDGIVISDSDSLKVNDVIDIRMSNGTVSAEVNRIE